MTITTEEAERLAGKVDFAVDDPAITATALRSLAAERDALRAENARLREALRAFPGFVDDATIGDVWIERKNAALGGEGNE
jgi:hypothetical protein